MLYRNSILQEKGRIISIYSVKVVIIKECHSSVSGFDFISRNRISKAKINKKLDRYIL